MESDFKPPIWQIGGHLQTIYPSAFRVVPVVYTRERVDLPDGDFLDLDWVKNGHKKLVVVTHGLEGDSSRHYVTGIIKKFTDHGYDGLAWNSRSCSGEINRLPRFYHHGDAGDLKYVVEEAIKRGYQEVFLVGFSMGGSLTIRLLGEYGSNIPSEIKGALVGSVPLDLPSSVRELYKKGKRFYMNRFIKKLAIKIEQKSKMYPDNKLLRFDNYWENIKNFEDFDNRYTAPLHGYRNAEHFYQEASAKPLVAFIKIPTLILQAQNDPFLSTACFDLGTINKQVKLMVTPHGGHVGFMQSGQLHTFAEDLALAFCRSIG